MSRVFVNPQAGRDRHARGATAGADADAWGTTSNQAQFRGYEPAEMRSCRSEPQHVKPAQEKRGDAGSSAGRKAGQYNWYRFKEDFPDHSFSGRSAVTASDQTSQNRSVSTGRNPGGSRGSATKPLWATVHERPIPNRTFDSSTSYALHQDEAQQSRHEHFPYRDEYAPRSKRLLYEMAYARASRDSVKSGSTADTVSCFTMSSAAGNSATGRRSASTPSLAGSQITAASSRVVGGIARRRHEASLRSPALCDNDKKWFDEKWQKEGPYGLTSSNFVANFHRNNFVKHAERLNQERWSLNGIREDELPTFG